MKSTENTKLRILVIEDLDLNIQAAKELNSNPTYEVVVEANFEAGEKRLNEESWDIVLTDCFLPKNETEKREESWGTCIVNLAGKKGVTRIAMVTSASSQWRPMGPLENDKKREEAIRSIQHFRMEEARGNNPEPVDLEALKELIVNPGHYPNVRYICGYEMILTTHYIKNWQHYIDQLLQAVSQ